MRSRATFFCTVSLIAALSGCSSGNGPASSGTTAPAGTTGSSAAADFTLAVVPLTTTVNPGGSAQTITLGASPVNGFTGSINVTVGSLPAGVTVSPMTIALTPGALQQLTVTAGTTAAPGNASIALQAASGSLSHSISAAVTVTALATAKLSTTSFNFGNDLLNSTLTQSVVTVTNSGAVALTLNPSLSGDPSYALVSTGSCGAQLAPAASCPVMVSYTPTTASAPATQNAVLNLGLGGVTAGTLQTVALTGTSAAMPAGQVTATANPQVALYTMTLPFPGSMTVNFGKDTTYGTKTWSQSTPDNGGEVSIFVAGMQASTTYHMQATVQLGNGITATDSDHSFTTQAVPANLQLTLTATTASGMTPQPGIELLNTTNGKGSGLVVTDLAGNTLWTYAAPGVASNNIQGAKLLPNGDFLMAIGPLSSAPLTGIPAGTISEIREVNLGGETVREITVEDVNALLQTATCAECKVTLQSFHHDIEPLPNGHWLILANTSRYLTANSVPSLNNAPAQNVLGDVVIDLDQNLQPVWAWNAFNHLQPNYHPFNFPDWTHANAVLYSPTDGNLLISMRHTNRVIKVDYENGTGSGAVLWRLGEGGDLTLKNGVDPTDWPYAQHYPTFFTPTTSGVFSLGLMDNGDDRSFPANVQCGTPNNPSCLYTTIPVFQIDEKAMTATLVFHQILASGLYNNFGGSVDLLANANIEYDLCGVGADSDIFEVTPQSNPQTVWTMHVKGTNVYRGFRMPSMYPGVQW